MIEINYFIALLRPKVCKREEGEKVREEIRI